MYNSAYEALAARMLKDNPKQWAVCYNERHGKYQLVKLFMEA